jgi:hypothetical protein
MLNLAKNLLLMSGVFCTVATLFSSIQCESDFQRLADVHCIVAALPKIALDNHYFFTLGARRSVVVKELSYKPEGRGFETRLEKLIF